MIEIKERHHYVYGSIYTLSIIVFTKITIQVTSVQMYIIIIIIW